MALSITLAGHGLSSGQLPSAFVLSFTSIATVIAARACLRTTRSFASVTIFILALQLLVHVISTVAGHHGTGQLLPSLQMITYHVIASILASIVIRYGNTLITLWCVLWQTLLISIRPPALPTAVRLNHRQPSLPHHTEVFAYAIWHRGPPVSLQN